MANKKVATVLPFNEAAFFNVRNDVAGRAPLRVSLLADDDAHFAGRVFLQPEHLELLAGQRRQRRRQVGVVVAFSSRLVFGILRDKIFKFLKS